VCEIFIFRDLLFGRKLVVITAEGFRDCSTTAAAKNYFVPWEDVAQVEKTLLSMGMGAVNQPYVSIMLKDPDKFFAALPAWKNKIARNNMKMGFGHINISLQNAKNCSYDRLVEVMRYYMQAQAADPSLQKAAAPNPASPIEYSQRP
jgi:hypothetical protein